MFRTWWQKFFSFPRSRFARRRGYRPPTRLMYRTTRLSMTALEDRITPATFFDNGTTLNLVLTKADINAAIVSNGASYSITLASASSSDTWSGTNDANVTGNGTTTLTITAAGIAAFTNQISVTDAAAGGDSVQFSDSGANTYANNFNITLINAAAGPIFFAGNTSFVAANSLSAFTADQIHVGLGTVVSTTNGNLTLTALGTVPGDYVGVTVDAGTVQATGTGVVNISGRGGNDATTGVQFGVEVEEGGVISGGTAGTTMVSGMGGASTAPLDVGVDVLGAGSKITSAGSAVDVTGTGGGAGASSENSGVAVAVGGTITAGGTGTVTVKGTGGTNDTGGIDDGVDVVGGTITSGGGNVTVNGTGGGMGSDGENFGVSDGGTITAGGSGTVTVMGTGGATSGVGDIGVGLASPTTASTITSGGGNVTVTGQGGGTGASGLNYGVDVVSAGPVSTITAGGTGTVTVNGTGGATTGMRNFGVWLNGSGAKVTSNGGAVAVTGTAGGGGAVAVEVDTDGLISSSNNAPVTVTADSMGLLSTTSVNAGTGIATLEPKTAGVGIDLGLGTTAGDLGITTAELNSITAGTIDIGNSSTGAITVTAAVQDTADANLTLTTGQNIVVNSGASLKSVNGNLTLSANEQATPTSGNFAGIVVSGTVTSAAGDISIQGKGGDTGAVNVGVFIRSGGIVSSTGTGAGAATITITGTGGAGTSDGDGVIIEDANSLVTSVAGAIAITGTGGNGTADDNVGVAVNGPAQVTSTGTTNFAATITIHGTGGSGTGGNDGVHFEGNNTGVSSVDGAINIVGTGGTDSAGDSVGVFINANSQVVSTGTGAGAATITITGTGGTGITGEDGVIINGGTTLVISAVGAITITGTGGGGNGSIDNDVGVFITAGGVTSTGTGADAATITIIGTGGTGTDEQYGVEVDGPSSFVSSAGGAISIAGSGGGGSGNDNFGIAVLGGGQINATGAATVTLAGTGGGTGGATNDNDGIFLAGNIGGAVAVTSTNGAISVTGIAGRGGVAIDIGNPVFGSGTTTIASTGANITLTGDSINLDTLTAATINAGANVVTLRPKTAGAPISLGAGASGLGINDTELGQITAGILRIGAGNAGEITVDGTVTTHAGYSTLSLISGGGIVAASLADGIAVTNLALQAGALGGPGVNLNGPMSDVANLAGSATSGNFIFVDGSPNLLVGGPIDGVSGITDSTGLVEVGNTGSIVISTITGATVSLASSTGSVSSSGAQAVEATGTLTVEAATGITLNTSAAGLQATNGLSGNISITQLASPVQTLTVTGTGVTNDASTGTISITNLGASITVNGGSPVQSTNGNITLAATDLQINGAINSGTARTVLESSTVGEPIDLGTNTPGSIGLTNSELANITAGVLQVGSATAGDVNVSAAINVEAGTFNFTIVTAGGIAGSGSITVSALRLSADNAIDLPGPNNLNFLAGVVGNVGQGFLFNNFNSGGLTIGTVDGVSGIATNNGPIMVSAFATPGNTAISVDQNVSAGTASVNLTADAADGLIANNATITGSLATIVADRMALGSLPTSSISVGTAPTNIVVLEPFSVGWLTDLGSTVDTTANTLELSDAELGTVTAGVLQIASPAAGAINVSAAIAAPAGWSTLRLINNGAITEATAGSLTVPNLRVSSTGPVTLGSANNVGNLGASTTGSFLIDNGTNTLTIPNAGVNGVLGVTTNGANITLEADNIVIKQVVSPGPATDTTDTVLLEPFTSTLNITLGTASVAGSTFGITNAGLGWITSGITQVGAAADTGNIAITAAINETPTATAPTRSQILSLDTSGAIVENGGSIAVANLALQAGAGIGSAGAINVVGPINVAFDNTTSGAVQISSSGALTIKQVADVTTLGNEDGSPTTLSAASPMTFAFNVIQPGTITATTTNAPATTDGVITVNTGVTVESTAGDVDFNAGSDIDLLAGSLVKSDTGTVSLIANFGGTDPNAQVNLDGTISGANITLSAPGNITLGVLTATGTVSITSTNGAILNGTAPPVNITAGSLALSANTGIGVVLGGGVGALNTQVSNLAAQTTMGGIFVGNTGALNIGFAGEPFAGVQVTGAAGDINITDVGSISIITNGDIVKGPGNVTLTANGPTANILTGGGNQFADGAVVSTGGTVTLTAGQDLLIGNPPGGMGNRIGDVQGGGSVVLLAGRNIVVDAGTFVDAHGAGTLTATAGTAGAGGNISIQQTGLTGARFSSEGGAISLTTAAGGTFTSNGGLPTGGVFSNMAGGNGDITITADNMVIDDPINAGTGTVTLQQVSNSQAIDVGGPDAVGTLGLTNTELGNVTAGVLVIGRNDAGFSGPITVTAPITLTAAKVPTLVLKGGGSIVESGTGTLSVTNLAVEGNGFIGLSGDNHVGTLAGSNLAASAQFGFTEAPNTPLTIGTVDGLTGITTKNGNIFLVSDSLNITAPINAGTADAFIEQRTPATTINLGGADAAGVLGLTNTELNFVTAAGLFVGLFGGGAITITAPITLSTAAAPPATGTNALLLVSGGGIAETGAGTLSVSQLAVAAGGPVTLGGNNDLRFFAGGSANGGIIVTNAPSAGNPTGLLTVTNLSVCGFNFSGIDATGDVTITANELDILAPIVAVNPTVPLAFTVTLQQYSANQNVAVGSKPAGTLGLTNADLNEITARVLRLGRNDAGFTGTLTVTGPITLSTAAITPPLQTPPAAGVNTLDLRANGAISEMPGGTLTVANLAVQGNSTVTLTDTNAIHTLAGRSNGLFQFLNGQPLTVGAVDVNDPASFPPAGFLPGIASVNGDVDLVSTTGPIILAQPVNAGAGTVRIDSGGSDATGSVYQTKPASGGVGAITAAKLAVVANGAVDLCEVPNTITGTVAINDLTPNTSAMFLDTAGFTVGTVPGDTFVAAADPTNFPVVGINGVTTINGDIDLISAAGPIRLAQVVTAGAGTVRLDAGGADATGSVYQTAAGVGAITAQNLGIVAHGTVNLCLTPNTITSATFTGTVAINDLTPNTSVMFLDTAGFTVGTVIGDACVSTADPANFPMTGISGVTTINGDIDLISSAGPIRLGQVVTAGTGTVRLDAGGADATGSVYQTGAGLGAITALRLGVVANGPVNLCPTPNLVTGASPTGNVSINDLAASAPVMFLDTAGFTVGSVPGDMCVSTADPANFPLVGINGVITNNGDADLVSTAGPITLTQVVDTAPAGGGKTSGTATVRINSGGAVTQTAAGLITALKLAVVANGNVDLSQAGNVVGSTSAPGTFAAQDSMPLAAVRFRDAAGASLMIGTIMGDGCAFGAIGVMTTNGNITIRNQALNALAESLDIVSPITAGTGTVRLQAGGDVAQNPNPVTGSTLPPTATTTTTGPITAAALAVGSGNGSILLDRDNTIGTMATPGTFAADAPNGNINFRNTVGLKLDTIAADTTSIGLFDAVMGVNTGVGTGVVRLATDGGLTQTTPTAGPIVTGTLGVNNIGAGSINLLTGVSYTGTGTGNSVGTFAASNTAAGGAVNLATLGALTVGSVPTDGTFFGSMPSPGVFTNVRGIMTINGASTLETGTDFTAMDAVFGNKAESFINLGTGLFQVDPGLTPGAPVNSAPGQTVGATVKFDAEVNAAHATFGTVAGSTVNNASDDSFFIRPSQFTSITVNGNLPTVLPGDSLQLYLQDPTVTDLLFTPLPGQGNGMFTFTMGHRQTLNFTSIERLPQASLAATAIQTGPNSFTIQVQGVFGPSTANPFNLNAPSGNPFIVAPAGVNPIQPFGAPRLAVADINGDGVPDLIIAAGPDSQPLVTVVDGTQLFGAHGSNTSFTGTLISQFFAYNPSFLGGVFVAAGYLDGPGKAAEIVTGADQGGGPHVQIFAYDPPTTGATVFNNVVDNAIAYPASPFPKGGFFAYAPNFTGGVRVAVGDVNKDGHPDIITGAGPGGGPHVEVFSGANAQVIDSFYAYESTFTGGVYVGAGDYNNDGYADILTGPGLGGGPRVRVFSGLNLSSLADFYAFGPDSTPSLFGPSPGFDLGTTTGVGSVAFDDLTGAVDASGNPLLDIVVGSARGPHTRLAAFANMQTAAPINFSTLPSFSLPYLGFTAVDTTPGLNFGDLILPNLADGDNVAGIYTTP